VGVEFVVVNAVLLLALLLSFLMQWRLAVWQTTLTDEWVALRKLCKLPDYMALLISLLFTVLIILALIIRVMAANPFVWLAYGLLLVMLLAMLILCIADKGILKELKQYKAFGGIALGLVSFAIPYFAAPLADSAISEFTDLEAALFPRAQNVFVLIMSLLLWPLALSVVGLLAFLPLWLKVTAKDGSQAQKDRLSFMNHSQRRSEQRKQVLSAFRWIAVFIALAFILVGVPSAVMQLVSAASFNNALKRTLVFSSFHLSPQACGLSDPALNNAKVVQVRLRTASVAIPEGEDDFRFERLPCVVPGITRQPLAGG